MIGPNDEDEDGDEYFDDEEDDDEVDSGNGVYCEGEPEDEP